MRFWKIFAWITLGWGLLFRRGDGVLIRKRSPEHPVDAENEPLAQSGPGWRRVSTRSQGPPRHDP